MKKIVFIASHLGYPMEKTPLGGGAMVGLQLVRHWPKNGGFELTVLGSGPEPPDTGVEYIQVPPEGHQQPLVKLSELQYAKFSRRFETAATDWLLTHREKCPPSRTCVVVNDIAEGPDLKALAAEGYPIVSVWHVDVVDYFNKLYLRNIVGPEKITRLYERSRRLGMHFIIPDMLKVVFEKQRGTVRYSTRMIMPSRTMARTVERCYRHLLAPGQTWDGRIKVVPWGMWKDPAAAAGAAERAEGLRRHYQLGPKSAVVMTLSRISPEKGLHLLLEALRLAEADHRLDGKDVCLFLCGEPAFMQGSAYMRKVERAARRLSRVRVFFPGYLAPPEKAAYLRIADLFVSPSIHESYGLNVVEAMQAGVAILASDHYGVQDIMDPSFGRMVHYPSPARAPDHLAEALGELLSDPERLKEMGRASQAAAERMPFSAAADEVLSTALETAGEGPR